MRHHTMKFVKHLATMTVAIMIASPVWGQIQHLGRSPEQDFLICAQNVLGKPILWQDIFDGPLDSNRSPKVACPMSRNDFVAALKQNEGITVFENDRFAFLVTTGASKSGRRACSHSYDKVPIKLKVIQRQSPGSRPLTEREVNEVTAGILRNTRGLEILWTIDFCPEADCRTEDRILVMLELETRKLDKTGSESVVAFLRATPCADDDITPFYYSDVTRLVYGEIARGVYTPKWDSPLLYAPSKWIMYKDLNGDGSDEIVIWPSELDEFVRRRTEYDDYAYRAGLVAFDRHGHELTRGGSCPQYSGSPDDRVCPIEADEYSFVPAKAGKQLDIVATNWVKDHWRNLKAVRNRLHLVGEHYEPVPVPPLSPKPLHTETLPAKDVGLLLGLRWGGRVERSYEPMSPMYGRYRTFWITRVAGKVQIDQAPNLLLPRLEGFWQVGSDIESREGKKQEFIWMAPLEQDVPAHALTEIEDEDVIGYPIQFISPDYVGIGRGEFEKFDSLYTFKLDDPDFPNPLDISAVFGPAGTKAQIESDWESQDVISATPLSMQSQCHLDIAPINWTAIREQGSWSIKGWGKWTDFECSDELPVFQTSLRAPAKLVGFDELPVTWAQITKAVPGAADAFGAPTWGLLIILTYDELLVCPVAGSGIGKPLARLPILFREQAVMAQWAVGKYVASWSAQFEIFKKKQGLGRVQ